MVKAILLDGDGVVIKEEKRFGDRLSEDFNIPYEKILPFFKNEFILCREGKADLKEEIVKYFNEWNYNESADDLVKYWVEGTFSDKEVLKFVNQLRKKGLKCYLATDQMCYRAEYILKDLGLENYFDKCFFSCDLKCGKEKETFFEKIIQKLQLKPEEILYWDDDEKNVEIAKKVGINAKFYSGLDEFERVTSELL